MGDFQTLSIKILHISFFFEIISKHDWDVFIPDLMGFYNHNFHDFLRDAWSRPWVLLAIKISIFAKYFLLITRINKNQETKKVYQFHAKAVLYFLDYIYKNSTNFPTSNCTRKLGSTICLKTLLFHVLPTFLVNSQKTQMNFT